MNFKIGDKVEWTSQAGGNWKVKRGEIVLVEKAGAIVHVNKNNRWNAKLRFAFGSFSRDHESYLVLVPHPGKSGKGKPSIYWPIVKNLEKVSKFREKTYENCV